MKPKRLLRIPNRADTLRREALEEVRAVYRDLAGRPIERACTRLTGCCQFKLTGRTPQLTRGEAMLAARALRASGRKALPERADGACPLLRENGACLDLIRRLEAVDARLGGNGPRALTGAVRDELRAWEK